MKKRIGIFLAILVAALCVPATDVSAAGVNDFYISSYDIRYELTRDSEGVALLKTTETITAEFPFKNQNHGIERALPSTYDGHSTQLNVVSVTDENGKNLRYSSTTNDRGAEVLRIGDANKYVHGTTTYRISYTQKHVAKFFANTDRDEWYWDTNGTEWKVPIQSLSVSVITSEELEAARSGDPQCYQGRSGSTDRCIINNIDAGRYAIHVQNLAAGENVTLAVGFNKGTFVHYQPTVWEVLTKIWQLILVVSTPLAILVVILLFIARGRRSNRDKELHTIPVEYIPPKDASVLVSSQVVTPKGSAFSAQLIDFAVRHKIAVIETSPKTTPWSTPKYDIRVIADVATLQEEEQEILRDMFGGRLPAVGEQVSLSSLKNDTGYYMRTADNDMKLTALVNTTYAMREKSKPASQFFYRWAIVLGVLGLLTFAIPVLIIAGIVAAFGATLRPLTDSGLELRRYLLGLDKYIKASEEERLKLFQGPDTAQKIGEAVDVTNSAQILKLYERVLPYAILFGREKEWTKRLGEFYDTTRTTPDWYVGTGAFNAAMFGAAVSSFSSAASYSGGSSSSSGGSSGGGSSGGGGGGGGGGGW